MNAMARSIVGLFPDRASAEQAISDLKEAGFDPRHMGIVMRDREETRAIASDQGVSSTAGAVTGSAIGGAAGAILAATGAFVIPGIGPFISGGVLATALAGGAAGWLIGGLLGLGIPREEAEYYQGRVEQGSTLLSVDGSGRESEAQRIMLNNGAEDLSARGYGYPGATPSSDTTNARPVTPNVPTEQPGAVAPGQPESEERRRSYPTDADIIAEHNAQREREQEVDPKTGLTREQEGESPPPGIL